MKKNIILFLTFLFFTNFSFSENKFYKDAIFILPKTTKLAFEWLLSPDENLKNSNAIFAIDNKNKLWMGVNNNTVFNADNKILFKTDTSFKSFIFTDNDFLFFQTEKFLSYIPPNGSKASTKQDKIITVPLQAFVSLPGDNCKIKPAIKNGIYFIVYKDNKSFVYFLGGSDSIKKIADKSSAISYKQIFISDKNINAVAGNGNKTYVAIDNSVFEISQGNNNAKKYFTHPKEEILDLAFSEKAGVFYATKNHIGFTGKNSSFDFVKTQDAKIFTKGDCLYIFIRGNTGVLKIKNINDFKNYKIK